GLQGRQDRARSYQAGRAAGWRVNASTMPVDHTPMLPTHGPRSLANADWLKAPACQAVFEALEKGGYEARAVGGAVRNGLLGEPVDDVDIATTALPEEVIRLARAADL